MGLIFGQLGTKIFGGLSIFLLIAVAGMSLALRASHDKIERLNKTNAALGLERDTLLDSTQKMVDDGKARSAAAASALASQATKSTKLQQQRSTIVNSKPTTDCKSPPEVLNAEGL